MPVTIEDIDDLYAPSIKMLVAGEPGSGKTLTASTWPNPLYLDCEGRMMSLKGRKGLKKARITTLNDLEEMIGKLDQSSAVRTKVLGSPVDTVVVDTLDEVARMVIQERLASEKRETMSMQDWGYLGDTLRFIVRRLRNIEDLHVIFNVHLKQTSEEDSGRTFWKPQIQGAMGDEIAAYVDIAVVLKSGTIKDPKTNERVVKRWFQTYQDPNYSWIKDHSGALPMEFPVTFADDYERLAHLIYGDSASPASQAAAIAKISQDLKSPSGGVAAPNPPVAAPPAAESAPESAPKAPTAEPEIATSEPEEAETPDKGVVEEETAPAEVVDEPVEESLETEAEAAPETSVSEEVPEEAPEKEQASSAVPEPETVPEEEPAAEATEAIDTEPPETVTVGKKTFMVACAKCDVKVEPVEQIELSNIRYGETLCREHFAERKKAGK